MEKVLVLFGIDSDYYSIRLEENESYYVHKPCYKAVVSLDKISEKPTKNKTGRGFVKIKFIDNNGEVYKTIDSICVIGKLK